MGQPCAAGAARFDFASLIAVTGIGGRCPDYLSPPPDASCSTFRQELERLRATPPELMIGELQHLLEEERTRFDRLPHERERILAVLHDPQRSLIRLVDTLDRYHELVIAPYWPRIREHLEGDVLSRGRTLALGGIEALISGLDASVRYLGDAIVLDKSYEVVLNAAGREITLVPCVFSWPEVLVLVDPHFRPTLAYAPRGVANLWSSAPAPNGTALEAALGISRAVVLKSLLRPGTTTEIARRLDLSPASVSGHLSRLKVAGLVESHRSGKNVRYRLSQAGESVLEIFGELM